MASDAVAVWKDSIIAYVRGTIEKGPQATFYRWAAPVTGPLAAAPVATEQLLPNEDAVIYILLIWCATHNTHKYAYVGSTTNKHGAFSAAKQRLCSHRLVLCGKSIPGTASGLQMGDVIPVVLRMYGRPSTVKEQMHVWKVVAEYLGILSIQRLRERKDISGILNSTTPGSLTARASRTLVPDRRATYLVDALEAFRLKYRHLYVKKSHEERYYLCGPLGADVHKTRALRWIVKRDSPAGVRLTALGFNWGSSIHKESNQAFSAAKTVVDLRQWL